MTSQVTNLRMTYTHGKGWFMERWCSERAEKHEYPWIALSVPQPTLEGAIGAAGIGHTVSFLINQMVVDGVLV
jgi:hypothetical protein